MIIKPQITRPRFPRRLDTRVTWIASVITAAWLTLLVVYFDSPSTPPLFTACSAVAALLWMVRFEMWRKQEAEKADELLVEEMHTTNRANADDEAFREITKYLEEWEGEEQ